MFGKAAFYHLHKIYTIVFLTTTMLIFLPHTTVLKIKSGKSFFNVFKLVQLLFFLTVSLAVNRLQFICIYVLLLFQFIALTYLCYYCYHCYLSCKWVLRACIGLK